MKNLSFLIKPISICLAIVFFTNPIGNAMRLAIPNAQTNCGEWIIENMGSSDQRISVKRIQAAVGDNCQGVFTLYNQTGPVIKTGTKLGDISLGGYSFDLWPSSNNANYQFTKHDYPVLIPSLPIDITTTPIDIRKTGIVSIQSEITVKSASVDATLFLLKSIIDAADFPCVLSYDQFSLIAARTASVIENAVKLGFEGKIIESINEFSRVKTAFLEKTGEAAKEIGVSCLAELLLKKSFYLAKIGFSYAAWIGTTLIDYIKYKGTGGPLIILSYVPPSPPTPIPTLMPPTSTPIAIPLLSETIFLDTRNSTAKSSILLVKGYQYSIKISGTFSYWEPDYWTVYGVCAGTPDTSPIFPSEGVTNGPVGQDGFYFYAFPEGPGTTEICGKSKPPFLYGFIEISNDGGVSYFAPDPPLGFNKSHVYEFGVVGRGKSLLIKFNDSRYEDNRGQLKIEITP